MTQPAYSTKPSDDDFEVVSALLRSKVEVVGECWEWTGYRMPYGHGQMATKDGRMLVHRFVWSSLFGPIPNCVCHACDNPPCVRPTHLWLGTHKENMADMKAKGRGSKPPIRWDGVHCKRGHVIAENPYIDPKTGARRCKTCLNEKGRRYWREHPERRRNPLHSQTKGER